MSELLSPAGTLEAFYSAISNGADAIYLGLDKFSARAYAENFTIESLKDLIKFAHLRNVRIFVTINTIAYDFELQEIYKIIDELALINVDAIIVQDLAILNYITNKYKSIEAHASTQMGVDDLEAAKLIKSMGAKRIVFARETPLETIKKIKQTLGIEVEVFIHGALCVAYSGNCLMSSMVGERSGNRGRCAGCCRKIYSLYDKDENKLIKKGYLLSMKDLNTSNQLKELSFVDSLKIEGRMKEPNYVANVTSYYRKLLDNENINNKELLKVFNRTYTRGFMLGDNSLNITNIEKPNNYGYLIGQVIKKTNTKIWIKLNETLNRGDQIRIETKKEFDEISIPILKIFNSKGEDVLSEKNVAAVYCDKFVFLGAKVYKTKDIKSIKLAEQSLYKKEYKKIPINMKFISSIGKNAFLEISYKNFTVKSKSHDIVKYAEKISISKDNIINQLSKLNNTPYIINKIDITLDDNSFISLKSLNEIRRDAIEKLNEIRLKNKVIFNTDKKEIKPKIFNKINPEITVEVINEEQFAKVKELGIKHIYFKNSIRRNHSNYYVNEKEVLVGGLGGINYFKNKEDIEIVSDYSLNVTNIDTVAILSSLGVKRITLSEEISCENINLLIENYKNKYNTHPNLEMVVYGRSKLMHTQYCPLKRLGLCGKCKTNNFVLKDEFATFPIIFNDDCTVNIYNSKILNLLDNINEIKGINYFRLRFTTENPNEIENIINSFKEKLANKDVIIPFDKEIHTRGHFRK